MGSDRRTSCDGTFDRGVRTPKPTRTGQGAFRLRPRHPSLGPAFRGDDSGDRRLDGSPINYCSSYDEARVESCVERVRAEVSKGREAWCMFDKTLSAFATVNALALMERL